MTASDIETPPDPKLGDLGFPCFKLSKSLRKAPPVIAQEIAGRAALSADLPSGWQVRAVGPYVNFLIPTAEILAQVLGDILAGPGLGRYGETLLKERGSWVLEFSSPNVAKPLNIYHLRPTVLGAALDRIGRYRGFKVVSINHLGDWGKQYGMLTVALRKWGSELPPKPSLMNLVELYVRINAEAEKDPTVEDEARAAFAALEKNDPEVTAVWQRCRDISLAEFNRSYDRLGVKFDHVWGESFYKDQLAPLLADLRGRGLLVQSEGAWVVPVTSPEGKELPPCILEKSDGATIYATRDVAAAIYRYGQFEFDRMTYIVGQEQKLHFQQVFGVLRRMELPWASRCEHVPFGLYRFKDAKMSTRKGNFVTLDEVLELAKERVRQLMVERAKVQERTLTPEELEDTSEAVAIGAVVFHDLHTDPVRDVEFDVERVVDFEGETGPYLQYAHTRCLSILRKAADTGVLPSLSAAIGMKYDSAIATKLGHEAEIALLKTLGQLPAQLERTLQLAKASLLAHYLVEVTHAFGAFYRECYVLTEDRELSLARLMLVEATRRVLARGLGLLGVPLPERM